MTAVVRDVECPRCHQACGWCSDFRFMHGKIKLPGSRTYCGVRGLEPEGNDCPMCHGSRRVTATTTYAISPLPAAPEPTPAIIDEKD